MAVVGTPDPSHPWRYRPRRKHVDLPAMTVQARLKMAVDALAPRKARSFTANVLRAWGEQDLVDDAVLIVSELATNAFQYGRRQQDSMLQAIETIVLILELRPDTVSVHIRDNSPILPSPRTSPEDQEGGRGLRIVAALAQSWTATAVTGDGKQISAFLRRTSRNLPE